MSPYLDSLDLTPEEFELRNCAFVLVMFVELIESTAPSIPLR